MGKNQRHKKTVKADKAKVKLKQTKTKFLPKGQNVTNPQFKIKPIILSEQLKEKNTVVPLSKRKLDIWDLFSRIRHYNLNIRHSACEELAEMMKLHSEEIIQQNLSQLILAVSGLMQDKERKVRSSAVKVVKVILEVTPEGKLEPFYKYFLINMRCAMTNIDRSIQEDSLLFLDCFLDGNSQLIMKCAEQLLPEFFMLISKIRSGTTLGRTLTINLGSKMTSVTWRIKVLNRLYSILVKIFEDASRTFNERNMHSVYYKDQTFSGLYKQHLSTVLDSSANWNVTSTQKDVSDVLHTNLATIIPLLYETWMEIMPERKTSKPANENTLLNVEAGSIMLLIVSTLNILWKYCQKRNITEKIFKNQDCAKLLDHLILHFPYSQKIPAVKTIKGLNRSNSLEVNLDPNCITINILLCFHYATIKSFLFKKISPTEIKPIIDYANKCLLMKNVINNHFENLFELLEVCFQFHNVDLKLILENTILLFNRLNIISYKLALLKLLFQQTEKKFVKNNSCYNSWRQSLPKLLLSPDVDSDTVNALSQISKTNDEMFHKALLDQLENLLNKIEQSIMTMGHFSSDPSIIENIANMYFFVPKLRAESLASLQTFISNYSHTMYGNCFNRMITLRKELNRP